MSNDERLVISFLSDVLADGGYLVGGIGLLKNDVEVGGIAMLIIALARAIHWWLLLTNKDSGVPWNSNSP